MGFFGFLKILKKIENVARRAKSDHKGWLPSPAFYLRALWKLNSSKFLFDELQVIWVLSQKEGKMHQTFITFWPALVVISPSTNHISE